MKVVDRLFNKSEEIVFKELSEIAADNSLRIFPKIRLCDALIKDAYLPDRMFGYYTKAHFDFVVTDASARPWLAIEYDGSFHTQEKQVERDEIKNSLCKESGLPLLRIKANHVIKKFCSMTLLRWIIEVSQAQKHFEEAQAAGQVPYNEPFDPLNIISDGKGRYWPYWLSRQATIKINEFLNKQTGGKAWVSMWGTDNKENIHHFEYLRVNDGFLHVKTAAKGQDVSLPLYDMVGEIAAYEMGEELSGYLKGNSRMIPLKEFKIHHDLICQKYNMHLTSKRGKALTE